MRLAATIAEIERSLYKGGKRGAAMLLGEGDAERIGERLLHSSVHAELIGEVAQEASRMLGEPEPCLTDELFAEYGRSGERLCYEKVYFEKRKRLNAFAIMTLLDPEHADYRPALERSVLSICEEKTWCLPAHYDESLGPHGNIDLFAAETGFALGELLALLGDRLSPGLRQTIRAEVERRLFRAFEEQGPYGWEQAKNNWSAVCAGSVGAAALYLMDDSTRLATLLARVLKAMDCFLGGYGEDGACVEGYLYWQYGFGYYVYFMSLVKEATDGAIDGFAAGKVREIALFQQRCFSSGDLIVNFSDALPRSGIFMGLTACLRREYAEVVQPSNELRAPYAADHCGRWAPAIRNLLWQSDEAETAAAGLWDWPEESHYMGDAEWLVSRYKGADGFSYCFAAKGGHNAEPHNHNDCGHFMLHADGEVYLADLGSGKYSADYFGEGRYRFWCNGSQGHSVPIAGGCGQEAGAEYSARVTEANLSPKEDRFALDLTEAYPKEAGLSKLKRSFVWHKEDLPRLTLLDEIEAGGDAHSQADGSWGLCERFVTMLEPVVSQDGLITIDGAKRLSILYDAKNWSARKEARSDIDHFGKERHWFTLDVVHTGELQGDGAAIKSEIEFRFGQR